MMDEMSTTTIEEQLALHGVHYVTTVGYSMKPLFHPRAQTVKLLAYKGDAKRDDVILWRDATGKYILHRVVKVTEEGYITRGDNHRRNDPEATKENVIAVMDGYYKKEDKFVPVTSRRYRAYIRLWGRPHFIRNIWYWFRDLARRCIGRKPVN